MSDCRGASGCIKHQAKGRSHWQVSAGVHQFGHPSLPVIAKFDKVNRTIRQIRRKVPAWPTVPFGGRGGTLYLYPSSEESDAKCRD